MSEFYPPRLNPTLVHLGQSVAPFVGRWRYQMNLEIQPTCLEKLATLRDRRLLLLSNHPTFHDGMAMFLLSARLREVFHYLVAYEAFPGLQGRLLQGMGAYSIRRGLGDRRSVAQTLELLMQPACRLVIFPEGGCSFQNDTVMPFRSGAIHLALQAMSKLVKRGEPQPDLYVVPVSLKYHYTGDMSQVIHDTLSRLEKTLQIPAASDFYQRLRAVAERVLVGLEQDYDLHTAETAQMDWNQRILRLKTYLLQHCEQKLAIASAPGELARERVYKIQHVLESRAAVGAEDFWTYDIYKATSRLLNFDAIYDGYVGADPTPERFLDTLTRLEREVFSIDQPPPKGYRNVLLRIGEPVNLKDHFERYQPDRSGTVSTLTQQTQQSVQRNLDILGNLHCLHE